MSVRTSNDEHLAELATCAADQLAIDVAHHARPGRPDRGMELLSRPSAIAKLAAPVGGTALGRAELGSPAPGPVGAGASTGGPLGPGRTDPEVPPDGCLWCSSWRPV